MMTMMMKMRMLMMTLFDLVDNSPPGNCRYEAEHSILTAAKLISPVIEETFSLGYNWSVTIKKLVSKALGQRKD